MDERVAFAAVVKNRRSSTAPSFVAKSGGVRCLAHPPTPSALGIPFYVKRDHAPDPIASETQLYVSLRASRGVVLYCPSLCTLDSSLSSRSIIAGGYVDC